jgi:hypothetical protein
MIKYLLMLCCSWSAALVHADHYAFAIDARKIDANVLASAERAGKIDFYVEFGTEFLVVSSDTRDMPWPEAKLLASSPSPILVDELLTISHSCADQMSRPIWAQVGGYDILRLPVGLARMQLLHDQVLQAIPSNRVVAQIWQRGQKNQTPHRTSVQQVVNRVSADRWYQTLSDLAAFNRNSFSVGLFSARDWIRQRFVEAGLTPSDFNFQLANVTSCVPTPPAIQLPNIIGRKVGIALPDEWIVVGAHYDSRNPSRCDGQINVQPGANDNASGCAGVIELARVFADLETDRSILFMCFSGEEQGLVGSRRYVESLTASGDIFKLRMMLNMDMIGHDVDGTLPARIESTNPALVTQFATAATSYAPELRIITSSTPNGGSDHVYFQQANVPTVVTWENGASVYPHYHQSTDLPQNMARAREMAGGILKMNAAVLFDRAVVLPNGDFADGFE